MQSAKVRPLNHMYIVCVSVIGEESNKNGRTNITITMKAVIWIKCYASNPIKAVITLKASLVHQGEDNASNHGAGWLAHFLISGLYHPLYFPLSSLLLIAQYQALIWLNRIWKSALIKTFNFAVHTHI